VFTGTFALSIQFFFTPKYALNTYAVMPDSWDTWWLQIIFCLHECLFMYHAYAYQACTMVVAESMSTSYQHLLEEMTKVLYKLIEIGEERSYGRVANVETSNKESNKSNKEGGSEPGEPATNARGYVPRRPSLTDYQEEEAGDEQSQGVPKGKKVRRSAYRRQIMNDGGGLGSGMYRKQARRRYLDPKTKAPGTDYDIESLIKDYRKIMIASTEHNKWIGKLMGGAQAANYAQFVSDVFMMIQVS